MASVLAAGGFVLTIVLGAILKLAIERWAGLDDMEIILRRRAPSREVR